LNPRKGPTRAHLYGVPSAAWLKADAARVSLLGVLGLAVSVSAQPDNVSRLYETCTPTYPSGGTCGSVAIPDFPGGAVELTLAVPSDPDGNIIQEVVPQIWIQHTYQGDLTVDLISPAGTVVRLLNRPRRPRKRQRL
jgi:hypothetical protein